MKLRSRLHKYAFAVLLIGTFLALLVSAATGTTIGFRLWLAIQGLIVIIGLVLQGVDETKDDVGERKYFDASITGLWYGLLLLICAAFEYLYIQVLFAPGSRSSRLGFLIVLLVSLFTVFLLLGIGLYLVRAAVREVRRGWAVGRYASAIVKSLLFAAGALLCTWAVYVLWSGIQVWK